MKQRITEAQLNRIIRQSIRESLEEDEMDEGFMDVMHNVFGRRGQQAGQAVQRGAQAVGNGIQRGAQAVGNAVQRGAQAVGNYAQNKYNNVKNNIEQTRQYSQGMDAARNKVKLASKILDDINIAQQAGIFGKEGNATNNAVNQMVRAMNGIVSRGKGAQTAWNASQDRRYGIAAESEMDRIIKESIRKTLKGTI